MARILTPAIVFLIVKDLQIIQVCYILSYIYLYIQRRRLSVIREGETAGYSWTSFIIQTRIKKYGEYLIYSETWNISMLCRWYSTKISRNCYWKPLAVCGLALSYNITTPCRSAPRRFWRMAFLSLSRVWKYLLAVIVVFCGRNFTWQSQNTVASVFRTTPSVQSCSHSLGVPYV